MLHNMTNGSINATFIYDHTGLRVKKSFNGTDTLYTLNGKKITHARIQANGENTVRMHFFYDAQGRPSIIRYNDTDYAYVHNLQGDVIAIVDMDGNRVVEYWYDAWGRPTGKSGALAGTLGTDNPFRYRGYTYDEETGLYYLRSRYYNPEWGRFLNADVMVGKIKVLHSHNLFAYCAGSPILLVDTEGTFPLVLFVDGLLESEQVGLTGTVLEGWEPMATPELDNLLQRVVATMYLVDPDENNHRDYFRLPNEDNPALDAYVQEMKNRNRAGLTAICWSDEVTRGVLERYRTEAGRPHPMNFGMISFEIQIHYDIHRALPSDATRETDIMPGEDGATQRIMDWLFSAGVRAIPERRIKRRSESVL